MRTPIAHHRTHRGLAAIVFLAASLGPLAGCSILPGGGGGDSSLMIRSAAESASLSATFPTAAYIASDNNTADLYLSDLPLELFTDPTSDLRSRTGNLVHIHLFLMPVAGRTPIANSACNFTVRHVVLTGGQAGLYSGGGFILPASEPGKSWFSASVREATVRLARADNGFVDRLGVATLNGSVSVERNDDRARALSARLESIINAMPETPAAR